MSMMLFNLDDVLVRGLRGLEHSLSFDLQLPEDTIANQLQSPELQELYLGQMSEERFWKSLLTRHNWNTTIDVLQQRIRDHMREVEGMLALVEEVDRRGSSLSIISNTGAAWAEHIERRYPQLQQHFPLRIYSYQYNLLQPHPVLFQKALEMSGRRPHEVVYIGDEHTHLLGASKLGLQTLQFHTPHQLRTALKVQGYLPL